MEFDQFITQMQELLSHEDNSLWAQGDMLRAQGLDAAGMRKAAEILNRSVGTLRDRERVSREFNDATDITRVTGVAWTVYSELSRVIDPALRRQVWESRPAAQWTMNAMREAVYKVLPKQRPGNRRTRTFTFEGYRLVLEATGDGLSITTESPGEIEEDPLSYSLDSRKHFVRYVSAS
jgi:hypothetical protein